MPDLSGPAFAARLTSGGVDVRILCAPRDERVELRDGEMSPSSQRRGPRALDRVEGRVPLCTLAMYTCLKCKKWSKTPATCWKCGQAMVKTKEVWKPKASIDDKAKTGTRDHVAMLSLATHCLLDASLSDEDHDVSDDVEAIDQVVTERWDDSGSGGKLVVGELKTRVAEAIRAMSASLGEEYGQFLVNLAMYNYHTAGGGRARKIADWLRALKGGAPDLISYKRPFDEGLPDTIQDLLRPCQCDGGGAASGSSEVVLGAWKDGKYVPPSRFTATLPYKIEQTKDTDPKVVMWEVDKDRYEEVAPEGYIEKEKDARVRYAFMGSFGFAEPSYSTWTAGDEGVGNEYSGTRLSLGAYSLCPDYVVHVLQLLKDAEVWKEEERWDGYKRYGGVRRLHLETLCKVARKRGYDVAITWAHQMAEIGHALAGAAVDKAAGQAKKLADEPEREKDDSEYLYTFHLSEVSKKKALTGLGDFFGVVRRKIEQCDVKVGFLESQGYSLSGFEHVWVQESSLWELSFLAASCLSLKEIKAALRGLDAFASWQPSVGDDPTFIHEVVVLPDKQRFHRLFAPTGTAAAKKLYEALVEMNYGTVSPAIGKKKLDPFTPYFEFYLEGGFLNKDHVKPVAKPAGLQIWVNLSDNLHSDLLAGGVKHAEAAGLIAKMLMEYAGSLGDPSPANVYVIDYTKFAGEMPHCVVYPILARLAALIVEAKLAGRVLFLRSNLKYHTGSLERYQSGEVLIPRVTKSDALRTRLKKKFEDSFNVEGKDGWELSGEYVSLMKKVYLLADAVAWLRWGVYAEAYLESVTPSPVLGEIEGFAKIRGDRGANLRKEIVTHLSTIEQRLLAVSRDVAWGFFANGALRAYIPSVEKFEQQLTSAQQRVARCLQEARGGGIEGPVAITVLTPEQIAYLEGPLRALRDVLRGAANSKTSGASEQRRAQLRAHFIALKDAWYSLRKLVPDTRRTASPLPAPLSPDVSSSLEATLVVLRECEPTMGHLANDTKGKALNRLGTVLVAALRQDVREFMEDLASLASVAEHRFLDADVRRMVEVKLRQVAVTLPRTLARIGKDFSAARKKLGSNEKDLARSAQVYESHFDRLSKVALGLADELPEGDPDIPKGRVHFGVIPLDEGVKSGSLKGSKTTARSFSIKPFSAPAKGTSLLTKSTEKPVLSSSKGSGDVEEGDQHWYSGEEIALLLRLRLADIRDRLYLMVGINAAQHGGYTIADNLREARDAAFIADAEVILLPVHVGGNHWTALFLGFHGDYDSPTVQYADPKGTGHIPPTLRDAIAGIFPGRTLRADSQVAYQPLGDGHNCGPWTVALLEYMARNDGALPARNAIQIAARRVDDGRRIAAARRD